MTVTIETRTVYGNEMIYPIGESAEHVKRLTGKKTVDLSDLRALQGLGIEVVLLTSSTSTTVVENILQGLYLTRHNHSTARK